MPYFRPCVQLFVVFQVRIVCSPAQIITPVPPSHFRGSRYRGDLKADPKMTLRLLSERAIRVDVAFIPLQNAFIYYVQLGRIHQEKMAFATTCLEIALVANMLRQRERGRHNSNSKVPCSFIVSNDSRASRRLKLLRR